MLYFYLPMLIFILALPSALNQTVEVNEDVDVLLEAMRDQAYCEHTAKCINAYLERLLESDTFLTTVIVNVTTYPAHDITEKVMKTLHQKSAIANRWTLETTTGQRNTFKSFGICIANCDKKANKRTGKKRQFKYYNKKIRTSSYYLIILEEMKMLNEILNKLKKTNSYDRSATFIVYYEKLFSKNKLLVVKSLLQILYNNKNYVSAVIIPDSLNNLELFSMDVYKTEQLYDICGSKPRPKFVGNCYNGVIGQYAPPKVPKKALGCTLPVVLMIMPPMVITKDEGVEIEILNVIKERLNLKYTYEIEREAKDWGVLKNETEIRMENCSKCSPWTSLLRVIDTNPYKIGVGRVTVTPTRSMHFDFSLIYYMEGMLWVVPSADLIPPWASIITIFEWPTWAMLFFTVFVMGILTYVYAKLCMGSEHHYLKSMPSSLLVSVQVFLTSSVRTQPKSDPVRCLFISYAMCMIIVSSLYQSSLIGVLTNPRYEHQINSENEVFDSGIGVGGLSSRKEIFNNSKSQRDIRIFNNYEIYAEVNNTEFLWLLTVAKDRDTITILGEFYAKFFINTKHPLIVDHHGRPKVHLIKNDVLYTEQVSVIFNRAFIMKTQFDNLISLLFESGLISKWREIYESYSVDHEIDSEHEALLDNESKNSHTVVITIKHLQGAFVFYLMGHAASLVAFPMEIVCARLRRRYIRIRFRKAVNKLKHVAKFRIQGRPIKSDGE